MNPRPSSFQRSALGVLLVVAGVVMVLGVTGVLLIDRWMRKESAPVLAALQRDTAAEVDFFCEQQTLLAAPTPLREPFDLTYEPMPQLGHLILWTRLRLLQGLRTGQTLAAARDVRHLAWLVYSTDTLVGAMVASTLLDSERAAHASLQAPPPEWRPMSSEQVARMRAVITSGFIFSYPPIAVEVAKKSRRCGEPVVRCVSMAEAAFTAKILEPWARRAYREAYTALEEDLEAFLCLSSLGKHLW